MRLREQYIHFEIEKSRFFYAKKFRRYVYCFAGGKLLREKHTYLVCILTREYNLNASTMINNKIWYANTKT